MKRSVFFSSFSYSSFLLDDNDHNNKNQHRPDVRGILRGEGWVVGDGLSDVQRAVGKAHAHMDTGMPSMVEVMPKPWPTAPTYFKLNAFTVAYQVCFARVVILRWFCFASMRSFLPLTRGR